MSTDLAPLFTHPELTTVSAGAYSQQARCYQKNAVTLKPTALQASLTRMMTCEFVPRDQMDFMGYSVRTREWRYTEWVAWNKTAMGPIWERSVGRELYDHRVETMPMAAQGHPGWRENENLAEDAARKGLAAQLSQQLRAHFAPRA